MLQLLLSISCLVQSVLCGYSLAANVLALGAVADYGAQKCQYTTKVDAK
jgi:hypothetical protein